MLQNPNANKCVDREIATHSENSSGMRRDVGIFCFLPSERGLSSSQSKINEGGCGRRGCYEAGQLLAFLD